MAKKKDEVKKDEAPKEKKLSYLDKIRMFMKDNKGVALADELAAFVGADRKNLSVSISILRNEARTKDPLNIQYVRSIETYFCVDMPAGKTAMDKVLKLVEDQKKADKKAKAAEKKDK